jgi:hypothetical protein
MAHATIESAERHRGRDTQHASEHMQQREGAPRVQHKSNQQQQRERRREGEREGEAAATGGAADTATALGRTDPSTERVADETRVPGRRSRKGRVQDERSGCVVRCPPRAVTCWRLVAARLSAASPCRAAPSPFRGGCCCCRLSTAWQRARDPVSMQLSGREFGCMMTSQQPTHRVIAAASLARRRLSSHRLLPVANMVSAWLMDGNATAREQPNQLTPNQPVRHARRGASTRAYVLLTNAAAHRFRLSS